MKLRVTQYEEGTNIILLMMINGFHAIIDNSLTTIIYIYTDILTIKLDCDRTSRAFYSSAS